MPSDICCVFPNVVFYPCPVKRCRRALVVTNFVSLISVPSTKSSLTPLFLLFPKSLPTFREPLRSSHSHIPFGLLFNFQGTVRRSFTYSHWERANGNPKREKYFEFEKPSHLFPLGRAKLSGVFEKIFCFAKDPFTHLDKGGRNAHPFLGFFSKIF